MPTCKKYGWSQWWNLVLQSSPTEVVTMEFTCKILKCLHFKLEPLDIKNPPGGGPKGGQGWGGGHQDQGKDQTKVFNTNPKYRKWFIQENESYSEIFHSRANKFPKDNNCVICMKFFLLGKSFSKCSGLHQLFNKAVSAVDKFIKDCCANPVQPLHPRINYGKEREEDTDFVIRVEKTQKT